MSKEVKKVIYSEQIEPSFARIIGALFKDCEEADTSENNWDLEDKCQSLWSAIRGMRMIATGVHAHKCSHLSVAVDNHTIQIANYIERKLNINPLREWKW